MATFGPVKDAYYQHERPSFVYVMRAADGRVKIGKAAHPSKRARQIELASGLEVEVLAERAFTNAYCAAKAEAVLHRKFGRQRTRGEWFNIGREVAVAGLEAAMDAQERHGEWHADMPPEIAFAGSLERWKWRAARGQSYYDGKWYPRHVSVYEPMPVEWTA